MELRPELLSFATDEGGLEVVDLLLQQIHRFSAAEAAELGALPSRPPSPPLRARLEGGLLLEGPDADALRESARQGQIRRAPQPPPAWPTADGPWALARTLPDSVAPAWHDPERWRRLAEDRIAGRILLRAEGFLTNEAALELRARAEKLPFVAHDGMYARGECYNEHDDADRLEVMPLFSGGPLHTLLSHVMGEDLAARIFLRCWRLRAGDHIAVHNDGVHYVTTFSIGLSQGWTAQQGGAIAFGVPGVGGIEATERWLPHLGDLILFRPTAMSWHAVEHVTSGDRMTVTGHYVADEYPG